MPDEPEDISAYRHLTEAAVRALSDEGWTLEKEPGKARQNVWRMTKRRESVLVSIKTTQNRWIAYNTMEKGSKWKTLDEVDRVCIAAYAWDDPDEDPARIEVHLLDAATVRKQFDTSYRARTEGGQNPTENFGMWICMDPWDKDPLGGAGSGFATKKTLIATYPYDEDEEGEDPEAETVADVVAAARERISEITGIPVAGITLELRMTI